ncbi:MAG: CBS domain-containing protein [Proteobacteria bacterium]|nr:CBS domain-containing protein [Pseudomonadota bacterium]
MLILEIDKRVKGDPKNIWEILTDMDFFAEAAPNVKRVEHISGNGLGMVRRIHHNSGRSWEETCKDWEVQSYFTMQANTDNYPLPISNMRRITSMEQIKNSVLIKIRYEYTPKYGPFGYILDKYQLRPILKIFGIQLIDNLTKKINQQSVTTTITAATILNSKDSTLISITPETLISEACELLTEKRIGCVMVLNPQGDIAGILSERDVVNGIANAGQAILDKPAKEIMTEDVITSRPEDTLEMIMACMNKNRFRHLPIVGVLDKLLGVVSIGDVVNAKMSELENESNVMQQYIEGRKWREVAMQIGRGAATKEFS